MKSSFSPLKSTRSAALTLGSFAALAHVAMADPTTSYNTGSLGKLADGASTAGVVVDQPGAIAAYEDFSSNYAGGDRTEIPFLSELNPASGSPFTIEFWAKPTSSDDADAPVGNRLGGNVNRSGWVFFQRASGWNFRMYNGNGTQNGWDITGGPAPLNTWTHVVAVWSGTAATLFVNGVDVTSPNAGPGGYNANTTEAFRVGALIGGDNGYNGGLDDVAFYPTALTPAQITAHYTTASSSVSGAYSSLVLADGAVLYLQQNPPSAKLEVTSLVPYATKVSFTGVLSQSEDLTTWTDLPAVTSPYTPPSPQPGKLFYRAHR
ncbi:LamG domain-containing protein [Luteolibacter luteus]|uniref:LamG domain-containing protein n=1 Tax=Luteolibacter luteus TaxID=2728835 RepID=A0A858RKV2_9BACT|nr:LamG domain-containing protein [Luteolibacter luteus]QJE97946.1 LamG domain-containing protein [Luteolibacter luteus]